MKTQTKTQPKHNFASTVECNSDLSPHDIYESLAIDSALLAFNDQLPSLSDEENQRIIDAAQTAARAALTLARVPDDWLALVVNLHHERAEKVRSGMWETVFDLLPEDAGGYEKKNKADQKILALAHPGKKEAMRRALGELSEIYMHEVLASIYAAFTLGFEVATNPAKLIMEKERD